MLQPFEVLAGGHFPAVVDGQVVHRAPIINAISSPRKPCTTERNYAECAVLCTVGKGTYKMPWGHFMLYGVYASRRFANLHQTPFDTNLSKYFFHAMGNTTKAKSCEMLYVVASNTPKKCMKNIVMMLTLLTFFHSMTNTKHQHRIHHLHM